VEFNLNYGALLSAMTSPYVMKKIISNVTPNNSDNAIIKKTIRKLIQNEDTKLV
jgi:hypothetical protein